MGDLPAAEGDDLADCIRRYTPQLMGVARAFADDVEEAEDLLQELWILAGRQLDRRPAGAPLRAWLHTLLLNIGRARWRRRRRRERLMALWGHRSEEVEAAVPDANDALAREAVWREVARLPELQRKVLLLRLVEEMSTTEAAAALGRAEGTIKASLHRALRTLRERCGASDSAVRQNSGRTEIVMERPHG